MSSPSVLCINNLVFQSGSTAVCQVAQALPEYFSALHLSVHKEKYLETHQPKIVPPKLWRRWHKDNWKISLKFFARAL